MNRQNFFDDNEDIQFHFNNRCDWELLFKWLTDEQKEMLSAATAGEYRSGLIETLQAFGAICGETLAPHARQVEAEGVSLGQDGEVHIPPTLAANLNALREFGLGGISLKPEHGGMGLPFFIEAIGLEMMQRACPSTTVNAAWYGPVAHIVEMFGNAEQIAEILPRTADSEISGCMALTEADAGSDLAALRSYGEKQPDGTWRLYGSKRFITNGNGDYALVLAKGSKGAPGLESINLFLCHRRIEGKANYKVTKLEEKIGLHASPTCELQFDGSRATLLGKDGEGFRYMLKLMNDARIGVGLQGLGTMEAAFRLAVDYTAQRKTWNKPIAQHEMVAEKLLDMEVEIRATRSLTYQAAFAKGLCYLGEEYLERMRGKLPEEEVQATQALLGQLNQRVRKWTPLIKWWVGEKTFHLARTCLDLHGGYGFTTEYRAEAWLRESLILSLYEGTSHIQALMCLKDTMKDTIRHPRKFFEQLTGFKVIGLRESDSLKRKLFKAKQLVHAGTFSIMAKLVGLKIKSTFSELKPSEITRLLKALGPNLLNFESLQPAMLHAERLCELKSIAAMAQSLVLDAETDPGRRWVAERFLNTQLPRMEYLRVLMSQDEPVISKRLAGYSTRPEANAAAMV